jgi:hypothetical protein
VATSRPIAWRIVSGNRLNLLFHLQLPLRASRKPTRAVIFLKIVASSTVTTFCADKNGIICTFREPFYKTIVYNPSAASRGGVSCAKFLLFENLVAKKRSDRRALDRASIRQPKLTSLGRDLTSG